jgi:uncharacterized protein YdhG (YjbR/CyaY superfamily)
MNPVPATVDEYIAGFAPEIQAVLRAVRATLRRAAPRAEECISYRMPALFQDGVVVYFGAFKRHIGMYPPVQDPALRDRLAAHAGPKGNLRFRYAEPIPHALIAAIVRARLASNLARAGAKRSTARKEPGARAPRRPKAA